MKIAQDRLLEKLAGIVGREHVSDGPEVLERYSGDYSLVAPRKPSYVVWPANAEEVQKIVGLANEEYLPLVPRSSGAGFTGGAVPSEGGGGSRFIADEANY